MKITFLLLALITFNISLSQIKKTYIDIDGKEIKEQRFLKKWRSDSNNIFRWDYIEKDSGRVAKLYYQNLDSYKVQNYDSIVNYINKVFKKNITNKHTIVIEYYFLNDLCMTNTPPFVWSENYIKNRKNNSGDFRKNWIEKNENTIYLMLFEKGSIVVNKPNSPLEYFYIDNENFFKNNFLKDRVLCGSLLIIKPDGNLLIARGEKNILDTELFLKPHIQKN